MRHCVRMNSTRLPTSSIVSYTALSSTARTRTHWDSLVEEEQRAWKDAARVSDCVTISIAIVVVVVVAVTDARFESICVFVVVFIQRQWPMGPSSVSFLSFCVPLSDLFCFVTSSSSFFFFIPFFPPRSCRQEFHFLHTPG